jgi:geranylgeranyl pyrophosphate synthase
VCSRGELHCMWCGLSRFFGHHHRSLYRSRLLRVCGLPVSAWHPAGCTTRSTHAETHQAFLSTLTPAGTELPGSALPDSAAGGLAFLKDEENRKHRALNRVAEAISGSASQNVDSRQRRWANAARVPTQANGLPWSLASLASLLETRVSGVASSMDPFRLVEQHLQRLAAEVLQAVAVDHPVLQRAAQYFFELPGKRLRPAVVLLMAQATCLQSLGTVSHAQLQLAMITEMIHTASLLHDDVIDESNMRRSASTVNALFGNQLAVLAGDFLLARASVCLAQLRDCDVVELLSRVIEHLVQGEVLQLNDPGPEHARNGRSPNTPDDWPTFHAYMRKTWYKTASLIANSCRAVTLLNPVSRNQPQIVHAAAHYGDHLGLAFQLVDDAMDYSISSSNMGKPANKDLMQGTITAPVLLAAEGPANVDALELHRAWQRRDKERVAELVRKGLGVEKTLALAAEHAREAQNALVAPSTAADGISSAGALPPSPARDALCHLCECILARQR